VALLAAVKIGASAPAEAPPHPRWLAYEGRAPGAVSPLVRVLYTAPEVALFDDGQLIWLDTLHWRLGDGQNPCAWRTAHITLREKSDFHRILSDCKFFSIGLPEGTTGVDLPDAGRTFLGGHASSRVRELVLMSQYVPDSMDSRRYHARMTEVVDALRAMTQRVSDCYRPDRIRVAAFVGLIGDSSPSVQWPVSVKPGLLDGKVVEYRGEEAHKIVEALAVSNMVTIDGKGCSAAWAPVIDVPLPVPAEIPARNPAPPAATPSTAPTP
jgi:hypothetical protein